MARSGLLGRPAPASAPGRLYDQEAPLQAAASARPAGRRLTPNLRLLDALLPVALALWVVGAHAVKSGAMNEYGLLPALPVVFVVALVVLVASVSIVLMDTRLSPVRLVVHLVALVVVLHGTLPIVFSEPNFPWVYKHIGVARYINVHGGIDPAIDIYQNWPGFFALAAWFTRIAGVRTPLSYAAWAPVYFNLLTCLELAFVFRWLPVSQRVRWLALFLFVVGNWVGQDYFAPQAMAFVLSLAVFGMVLAWLQVDRPGRVVTAARRLAPRLAKTRRSNTDHLDGADHQPRPSRVTALSTLFAAFGILVVTHQLSPYVVILGVGLLTTAGLVRPRWVVLALAAMSIGYLLLRFPYVDRTQDLFGSIGDPLRNVHSSPPNDSVPMAGRRLTALAAPALIAGMWMLGALGFGRRLRAGRPTLLIALLALAPGLIALGQSYGGEVVFRIYLFSLPWTAVLAASALEPLSPRWGVRSTIKIGLVLSAALTLFLSAFYGAEELYQVRPGDVEASQFFHDRAEPDSVLTLAAPNFPTKVGADYDRFRLAGENPPSLLITSDRFRHRILGTDDLSAVSAFVEQYVRGGGGSGYLALSRGQQVYAEVLGLLPKGSLANLDRALASSTDWSVFHRNGDAVIYRFSPGSIEGQSGGRPNPPPAIPKAPAEQDPRTLDWPAMAIGLLGLGLLGMTWRRRHTMKSKHVDVLAHEEETMDLSGAGPDVSSVVESTEQEPLEPERAPVTVVGTVDVLLRQALVDPDARASCRLALAALEPAPTRLRELVDSVEPARQAAAVRILADAWGPLTAFQLDPLLGHVSGPVRAAALGVLALSPDDVERLQRLLSDDLSAEVRMAAIRALARAPEPDQLAALSIALADPDPAVRATGAALLPASGPSHAVRLLLAACEDEREEVRRAAQRRFVAGPTWALWMALDWCSRRDELFAMLEEDVSAERLAAFAMERMSSPDPGDRALAVELAGRVGTPPCVAQTIRALGDAESSVRRVAVTNLRGHAEAVHALIGMLQDDPDSSVRLAAAQALDTVEDDDAQLALVGALQDPAREVRQTAIEALVRRNSPGLARRLVNVLTSTNIKSVGEALLRMGAVGEDSLVSALAEGPPERAAAAAELISRSAEPRKFLDALRSLDPAIRLRAVQALGALSGPDVVDGLIAALSDSWPAIRVRAVQGLVKMNDKRGHAAVRRVFDDDQAPEVVHAAREGLLAIEQRSVNGQLGGPGSWRSDGPDRATVSDSAAEDQAAQADDPQAGADGGEMQGQEATSRIEQGRA